MLAIFLVGLFGLVIVGCPIAFALIGTGIFMNLAQGGGLNMMKLAQSFVIGCDSVTLMAIPFFMLAGEIMNAGGISKRIVNWANAMLGHLPGGLGYVSVLASMIFAGVSGSAVADTSAVGSILLPMMQESGYDKEKSTTIVASAGCIGPIIPPSTQMIIYGVMAEVSVSSLFLGGIVPGICIGLALMLVWFFHTRKAHYVPEPKKTAKERLQTTKEAIFAILLPFIIIGCIIFGVATATETAAIAVFYALLVSLVIYREMDIRKLPEMVFNAMKSTAVMMMVVGAANVAAYMITIAQIPQLLAKAILSLTNNAYVFMILVNIMLVLVGCVMDSGPAIMILVPILLPIAEVFGIDKVYFGVVMVTNLCIGLITPPVGNVLYVGVSLGRVKLVDLIKAIWPNIVIMFAVLFAITYMPNLILAIPNAVL
ncbi:MAG: TRAP transporter large permease [Lachnospiraceae bacterium]|nr:TRAP transporter large permease [Lachnospiraceae bacterium]